MQKFWSNNFVQFAEMKISVIIPTYNRADMVVQAISSMLKQDFRKESFEVIIVDNNSTDETEEILRDLINELQGKLNICYVKEERQGDVYARNTGAFIASGECLYFTDDDAIFDNNLLSEITGIFDKYPLVGMVGTRIRILWDFPPQEWVKNYEYLLGAVSYNTKGYIIKCPGMCIPNGSLAIRRKLFFEVGGNNPGQIGEWLVGNGEVGLFHKICDKGIPIAFTDDTTMWHMQRRSVNGTIRDIVRRIENIAISDAYGDVIEKGIMRKRDTKSCLFKSIISIFFFRRKKFRQYYFEYRANKKYNEWISKFTDKAFLDSIITSDYILNNQYVIPEVKYYSTYASTKSYTTA